MGALYEAGMEEHFRAATRNLMKVGLAGSLPLKGIGIDECFKLFYLKDLSVLKLSELFIS